MHDVDLKNAFDLVLCEALWDLLRVCGIPAGTDSAVKCMGGVSSFFLVNTEVRQRYVFVTSLFITCMDWILSQTVDQSNCGAFVANTKITDLAFADDAVIFAVVGVERRANQLDLMMRWPG